LSIDAYFAELKQSGTLDSTGAFTLNAEKLKGKLAEYQLANPREYAQFLVRAACAGGAREISSRFTPQLSAIQIEGLYFEMGQLQQFSFPRPESGPEEAAHYVAVALSAADRLGNVEILVGRNGRGFRVSSVDGQLSFHDNDNRAGELDGTLFEVSGHLDENPANKLTPRARWSSVPHQPDHFRIENSDLFGRPYIAAAGPDYYFSPKIANLPVSTDYPAEEVPDLILMFWCKLNPPNRPNVHGVNRGISYPMPDITLPRGLHAIVKAEDLKPDLSYGGLVQDEAYKAKGKMLRRLVFGLLEKVIAAPVDWDQADIESIVKKLDLYWPKSKVTPELQKFYTQRLSTMLPRTAAAVPDFLEQVESLSADLEESIAPYRASISQMRSSDVHKARKSLEIEGQIRKQANLMTQSYLDRSALFKFLYDGRWVPSDRFTEFSSVRKVVELLKSHSPLTEDSLQELEVHEQWLHVFLFHHWLDIGDEDHLVQFLVLPHPPIFDLIHALSQKEHAAALAVIARCPEFSRFSGFWKSAVLDLFRGELSWPLQIKLMAQTGLGLIHNDGALLEKAREPDLHELLVEEHIFSVYFWPLAVYSGFLRRRDGGSSAKDWLKIYLQSLLGRPGSSQILSELEKAPLKLPLFPDD
jgi:hypothetical protein